MNDISPSKLNELFKDKKINKREFYQRLIIIYDFSDSEKIRLDCLNAINSVRIKNENMFKFLEEIVVSEPNTSLRFTAITIILNNFPEKGFNLIKYLISNNESGELIMKIVRYLGESVVNNEKNLNNPFFNLFRNIILKIFKNEDVKRFEILWGDWFFKIPQNYWSFLIELKSPVGFVELFDYFINNEEIFRWFYENLFLKFSLEQWIRYIKISGFSGRLLYLLFYLEEQIPSTRFYQLVDSVQSVGKNFTIHQQEKIIDLLEKNNLNSLALILIFHWLNNFNHDILKKILEDPKLDLINRLYELIFNKQFDFLKYDYLVYSLIIFLVKINRDINERYLIIFFNTNSPIIFEKLLPVLNTTLHKSYKTKNSKIEKTNLLKFKARTLELLKILTKYIDLKLFYS